jgi:hypothetical protein
MPISPAAQPRSSCGEADEPARVKTLVYEVNLGSQERASGIERTGKAIT